LGLGGGSLAFQIPDATMAFQGLVMLFAHMGLYKAARIRLFLGSMKSGRNRINNYLALVLTSVLWAGCATNEEGAKSKEEALLQLHLEADFDTGDKTVVVPIYRAAPVPIRVYKAVLLDSQYLTDAAIVDVLGGFAIRLRFDFHGVLTLETASSVHRGSRLAVQAQFPEQRWLAAPKMQERIRDGVFQFTPDATREEAERLVQGLNNVAVRLGNRPKHGMSAPAEK